MTPIYAIMAAANANNLAMMKKFYTSSPVIIDEFAPYRWSGPNAVATWFAVGAFLTMVKTTQVHGTFADSSYWDAAKDRAEIMMPATFTFLVAGKPATDSGFWTFSAGEERQLVEGRVVRMGQNAIYVGALGLRARLRRLR